MNSLEFWRSLVGNPKAQATVASSNLIGGGSWFAGYFEPGIAIVVLLAGGILAVFMAINGYQKIQQGKLETEKLILELAELKRNT